MFFTTADAAPRNGVAVPSSTAVAGRAAFDAPAAGFSGAGRVATWAAVCVAGVGAGMEVLSRSPTSSPAITASEGR